MAGEGIASLSCDARAWPDRRGRSSRGTALAATLARRRLLVGLLRGQLSNGFLESAEGAGQRPYCQSQVLRVTHTPESITPGVLSQHFSQKLFVPLAVPWPLPTYMAQSVIGRIWMFPKSFPFVSCIEHLAGPVELCPIGRARRQHDRLNFVEHA